MSTHTHPELAEIRARAIACAQCDLLDALGAVSWARTDTESDIADRRYHAVKARLEKLESKL